LIDASETLSSKKKKILALSLSITLLTSSVTISFAKTEHDLQPHQGHKLQNQLYDKNKDNKNNDGNKNKTMKMVKLMTMIMVVMIITIMMIMMITQITYLLSKQL
jgi:hypothetical protein